MNETQTLQELLDSFNIDLDLPLECLSLEIKGNFDSYEIIQRTLSFINATGQMDYGVFDCYHFEDDKCYCEIVPDNYFQTVLYYTRLKGSGRWAGCSFDSFGDISVRS